MPTAGQLRHAGTYVPPHIPDHESYEPSADDARAGWIVARVVEVLRGNVVPLPGIEKDPDPLFTREEAARYLTFTTRTFDRMRQLNPEAIKPWRETGPLRFRRSTLDLYKLTGGRSAKFVRRGRPRKVQPEIAA